MRLGLFLILPVVVASASAWATSDVCAAHCPADLALMRRFRDDAVSIAGRKIAEAEAYRLAHVSRSDLKRRIATGGHFSGYFLWDTAFCAIWASRLPKGTFPAVESLDNLYFLATPEEYIHREYSVEGDPTWSETHPVSFGPPLIAWAERELYEQGHSDLKRLKTVYPKLVRHHQCCRRFRRSDGLYFGDTLGSGMDDLPRWPIGKRAKDCMEGGLAFTKESIGESSRERLWSRPWMKPTLPYRHWNRQAGWIDMTSQMAFDAANLAWMARLLGVEDDARRFEAERQEIGECVNRLCWDEASGFYYDRGPGGLILRRHIGAAWTLLAGIVPKERLPRFVSALTDYETFNRSCGVPALPKGDPDYRPETSYWCGVVWPPTTYMVICGLRVNGYESEAREIARRWYLANLKLWQNTGTVWENVSPEQCERPREQAGRDFCGWAALSPIALPKDFGWIEE